jgi:rhodanese-related sulfurtransferase
MSTTSESQPDAPEVDVETFADALDEGAVFIDVREPDEYTEAHIPGARLIPLGQLGQRLQELPEGRPLYVVCATGGRSLRAATALQNQAGIEAVSVAGGTKAWVASGRDYETGDSPT